MITVTLYREPLERRLLPSMFDANYLIITHYIVSCGSRPNSMCLHNDRISELLIDFVKQKPIILSEAVISTGSTETRDGRERIPRPRRVLRKTVGRSLPARPRVSSEQIAAEVELACFAGLRKALMQFSGEGRYACRPPEKPGMSLGST